MLDKARAKLAKDLLMSVLDTSVLTLTRFEYENLVNTVSLSLIEKASQCHKLKILRFNLEETSIA